MKTKKSGAYAAMAAVLLISAVLITNCIDPVNPGGLFVPKDKDQPAFVPPPGKGYVMLNFAGTPGRTIRPDTSGYTDVSDFALFDVVFTAVTPANNDSFMGIDFNRLCQPFVLTDDTYTVAVWAYSPQYVAGDPGDPEGVPPVPPIPAGVGSEPNKAIAFGTATGVLEVEDGDLSQSTPISLKELTTGAGTGTFELKLTNASATPATAASLTITKYPSGDPLSPAISGVNVYGQLTGYKTDLPSGFYRVSLALSRTDSKSVTIPEILYIYQGMTSTFTRTLPSLSPNVYTVTHNLNYTPADSYAPGTTYTSVIHGNLILEPPTKPTRTDYHFTHWFADSDETTLFNFGTTYVVRNTTLYAGWTPQVASINMVTNWAGEHAPEFTVTYFADNGTHSAGDAVADGASFNRNTPPIITITVLSAGSYSGFVWYLDSEDNILATDVSTYNLDFSTIGLQLNGERTIYIEAKYGSEPAPETSHVKFTVTGS